MKKLQLSLLLGITAGIIDVIPMIIQKLTWDANISAFVFWIVMGFIIPRISLPIKSWQKGLLIAELCALPIMILVFAVDPKAIIPIAIMSAILGSLIGFLSEKYAK